eukprot:CAMPEP_0178389204 /NCGR_PEP_ID=MMETSP0689_2-20121128/9991_1 /TAXON_ID=160604 /ORGANISM="Amphidinium massartii, Strain CS-259" /LENGTH=64 /DNA_ID=CAMNT_0020009637 /DNA_START=644 /DNA_END=838 /DNA_ORIENTATION=-
MECTRCLPLRAYGLMRGVVFPGTTPVALVIPALNRALGAFGAMLLQGAPTEGPMPTASMWASSH